MLKTSPNLLDQHGIWTAIITPFLPDGSIDWQAFDLLVTRQKEAKVTGIVISGTTGESPTLSVQEKLSLIKRAKAIAGSMKIMAGTGGNNTEQVVELSRLAVDAGCDSLLIATPYYNKPNRSGLLKHYEKIANSVKKPICLYHIPGRTGQLLSRDLILELLQLDNLFAVKESSGDILLLHHLTYSTSKLIFSGDDPFFLPAMSMGACGLISVSSNIFPKTLVKIFELCQRHENTEALSLYNKIKNVNEVLFCETNPCPVKAAAHILGWCTPTMRLPLGEVSSENFARIKKIVLETKEALGE